MNGETSELFLAAKSCDALRGVGDDRTDQATMSQSRVR
jgi:hypothetical protein